MCLKQSCFACSSPFSPTAQLKSPHFPRARSGPSKAKGTLLVTVFLQGIMFGFKSSVLLDMFFASITRLTFIIYIKLSKYSSQKAILSDVGTSGGKNK